MIKPDDLLPSPDPETPVPPEIEQAAGNLIAAVSHISGLSKLTVEVEIFVELRALIAAVQCASSVPQIKAEVHANRAFVEAGCPVEDPVSRAPLSPAEPERTMSRATPSLGSAFDPLTHAAGTEKERE